MFVLGLVLVILGILAILGALTTSEGSAISFLGFDDVSVLTVFFFGLGSGLAILWGFTILKFGTRRSLKHRREQKKLTELSDQLDRVQSERRHDGDDDRPSL